jgi:hypothetical protein
MSTPSLVHRLGAEALGTFWLVLGGCGSAIFAAKFLDGDTDTGLGIGFVGVSLAFGLTVLTMAYAVGHVSGGHFNPAVTIGAAVANITSTRVASTAPPRSSCEHRCPRQGRRHRRCRSDRLQPALPHRERCAARARTPRSSCGSLRDHPALKALEGVVMELDDCAFPTLAGVEIGDDPEKVFDGVNPPCSSAPCRARRAWTAPTCSPPTARSSPARAPPSTRSPPTTSRSSSPATRPTPTRSSR